MIRYRQFVQEQSTLKLFKNPAREDVAKLFDDVMLDVRWVNQPRQRVRTQDLTPTQNDVNDVLVRNIMKDWPKDDWQYDDREPIVVLVLHGDRFIIDGHHRLAAAAKLGKTPYAVVVHAADNPKLWRK
jgi:hypothetical protein